jgi:hypothetical protein
MNKTIVVLAAQILSAVRVEGALANARYGLERGPLWAVKIGALFNGATLGSEECLTARVRSIAILCDYAGNRCWNAEFIGVQPVNQRGRSQYPKAVCDNAS